jgi:hypothetical protein
MNPDVYYGRKEVSNSDLSWLKKQLYPTYMPDTTEAYKFGNLIDAMLTESDRVDFLQRTCDSDQFTIEDFDKAVNMKRAFMRDDTAKQLIEKADTQKIMVERMKLNYSGIEFELNTRCKWDIWRGDLNWGGDIKSTTATTQKQFEAAVKYFDYDRQRAWYMDIAGSKQDVLIAISKVNYKIFKVYINREGDLYKEGKAKYNELAFRWWLMFGENKAA